MRTLIIAALLVAPALAHADPLAVTAIAKPTEDAPRTYIAPGVALGAAGSHTMGAASLEIGERITDHLVLHAEGLAGATAELFGGSGETYAATGGIDATSCTKVEKVCAYAGFSAGYASSRYTEHDWFSSDTMSTASDGATGILRMGLDIGTRHVRWRPGFEVTVFGPSQGAFTNSVALAF